MAAAATAEPWKLSARARRGLFLMKSKPAVPDQGVSCRWGGLVAVRLEQVAFGVTLEGERSGASPSGVRMGRAESR